MRGFRMSLVHRAEVSAAKPKSKGIFKVREAARGQVPGHLWLQFCRDFGFF